jgi:hypothetical protein
VSLAALAVITCWFLLSSLLAAYTCDDTCSGDQSSWWGYQAQLALAAAGCSLAVLALALGFTSKTLLYRVVLGVSLSCALAWLTWVFGGGFGGGGF